MKLLSVLLTGGALLSVNAAHASDVTVFPEKPITVVTPFTPGAGPDVLTRELSRLVAEKTGQAVIVNNRPGASSSIAAQTVAKAPADGYTVLLSTVAHSVNPSLHDNLSFDPVNDFASVGLAARAPLVVVVNNDVPVKTLPEFLEYLKKNSGTVNYASAGIGSAPHLGGALLNHIGGFEATHVPYRGSAPAMADVIGGHADFMVDSAPTGLAQVQSGTVRLIATTMKERLPQTPDTPAVAEALPGYESYTWNAALVPAGTDPEVIEKLRSTLEAALHDEQLQERANTMGLLLEDKPDPAALDAFIAGEIDKWRDVVKESDMQRN